tara:strand:- start:397 stop:621 length:225 start_codon:yes stop_codon:yes gene_type:complete
MSELFSINKQIGDNEIDVFYKKKQVCEKYGISHMTLENWKKQGLKYFKIGSGKTSMIKYKKQHVDEFLENYLVN